MRWRLLSKYSASSTELLWTAKRASMSDLAAWLTSQMAHPAVDRTRLDGFFDIALSIPGPALPAPLSPPNSAPVGSSTEDGDYISAVQRQLGLRLEKSRGEVAVFVIASIHPPFEN